MKIDLKHCRIFAKEKNGDVREITDWLYFFEEEFINTASDIGKDMASCWESVWIEFDEKNAECSDVPYLLTRVAELEDALDYLQDTASECSPK